eukprot:gene3741-7427_t
MNKCNQFVVYEIITLLFAIVSDRLLLYFRNPFFRAIIDNLGHSIIAGLLWENSCVCLDLIRKYFSKNLSDDNPYYHILSHNKTEILISCLAGSLLDADHFISAKSLSLYSATHLLKRPFGHAVLFPFTISLGIGLILRSRRMGILLFSGLMSHLLRDGIRRGMWLWPMGSTTPIPYPFYLLCLFIWPFLIASVLCYMTMSSFVYTTCEGSDDALTHLMKSGDNVV